jgi:hypothetical protein
MPVERSPVGPGDAGSTRALLRVRVTRRAQGAPSRYERTSGYRPRKLTRSCIGGETRERIFGETDTPPASTSCTAESRQRYGRGCRVHRRSQRSQRVLLSTAVPATKGAISGKRGTGLKVSVS